MDVDLLVHEAWPAWEQRALGGWILRYAGGVTKRANSVLAIGDPDSLAESIAAVPVGPGWSAPSIEATSVASAGSGAPAGSNASAGSGALVGSDGSAGSEASTGAVTAFGSAVLAASGAPAGATGRLGLAAEIQPRSPEAPDGLEAAIRAAEAFYFERAAPCVFSIGAGASPGLDRALEERGYALVDPTVIMAGTVRGDPAVPVRVEKRPWRAWLEAWWAVDGRYATGLEAAERIVTGMPALYAAVEEGGVPVAVGRGVPQGDKLGIYCMATRPEARRRGLARAVLRALAAGSGLRDTYLVVTERNTAAQALYRTEGLEPAGGYHYRIRTDLHPRTLVP